ncbi:unnamed protein product [Fusarium venenatum]|uniref:Uncharacterized protein n=1 Tax=Fusarium venenatum TaxID=56646 RepID=A0A2L2TMI8_9HYPO|nr:uncharacterized protein FVRRES_02349 [Fusarium venenatum]CEI65837.1 unnamed protein product [Fusarium venenatum]
MPYSPRLTCKAARLFNAAVATSQSELAHTTLASIKGSGNDDAILALSSDAGQSAINLCPNCLLQRFDQS